MLLMSIHLQALDELVASEAAGHSAHAITPEASAVYRALELQGLALPQTGLSYSLTYEGREVLRLLEDMRRGGVLPAYREKDPGWRFLGSEILTAMEAAARAGRIGPATVELLRARGFAESFHEADGGESALRLNSHGVAWLALARRVRPCLEITNELASALLAMPTGYFSRRAEGVSSEALVAFEAMDLIAWSVPGGDYGTLTALGSAVYEALRKGNYPATDAVLDDAIVHELSKVVHAGTVTLAPERLAELQRLGYLTSAGTPSEAGEAVLRAREQARAESAITPSSFAMTRYEIELLKTVRSLVEREEGAIAAPTRTELHRVLVDRLEDRYQDFVREYGHTIELEQPRKRQAQAIQREMHEHEREYGDPADLQMLLVSLESLGLLRAERVGGPEPGYHLTRDGLRVLEAQDEMPRDIGAEAVKAVTTAGAAGRFGAPATAWVEQARAEGLLGSRGVTHAGDLYTSLAREGEKWPVLSRFEAEVLLNLPQAALPAHIHHPGVSEREREQRRQWALDALEARGLMDRLADGQAVMTARGRLVARAVSGALELAFPVTPALLRLLASVKQLGETLYIQEESIREAPEQWEELGRLANLDPDPLREAVHIAKLGHYLGDAGLTEAARDLLEAYSGGRAAGVPSIAAEQTIQP